MRPKQLAYILFKTFCSIKLNCHGIKHRENQRTHLTQLDVYVAFNVVLTCKVCLRDHISVCLNALRDNFLLSCEGPCCTSHFFQTEAEQHCQHKRSCANVFLHPRGLFYPLTQVFCEYTKMSQNAFFFFFYCSLLDLRGDW